MGKEFQENRIVFTKEMKKEYTILVPTMLPIHFEIMLSYLQTFGYKFDLLTNSGQAVIDAGLRCVHNDTCYPALLVIGQMINAIETKNYDTHKIALLITQTGGGCRASNYIALLRKALKKAGYEYIPVISLNFSGLESNPGFKITLPMIPKMLYTVLYGDLLMMLRNQCLPYEKNKGETSYLIDKWTKILVQQMSSSSHSYKKVLKNYRLIIDDFAHIEREKEKKVKVGIVGEIFVKFSPLGNNNLEDFLVSEGAEIKVPGLLGFVCYCVYNSIIDYKLYGINKKTYLAYKMIYNLILSKEKDMIDIIKEEGTFSPPLPFDTIASLNEGFVGSGAKMGEGWLLTAEMIELIKEDVPNIVCTQPFGCLPNHIVGKGMMNPIKKKYPNVNIVAIDYDSGASKINQENRIKLMLANAKEKL